VQNEVLQRPSEAFASEREAMAPPKKNKPVSFAAAGFSFQKKSLSSNPCLRLRKPPFYPGYTKGPLENNCEKQRNKTWVSRLGHELVQGEQKAQSQDLDEQCDE